MSNFFLIHDTVEANGKTIKENNLALTHQIPIGALVEVKYDVWYGDGTCAKIHARLFVVSHNRDCDGTPLYALSSYAGLMTENGFSEERLTVIPMTSEIRGGYGALEWDES